MSPSRLGAGLEESKTFGVEFRGAQIHVVIAIDIVKKAYRAINIQGASGSSYTLS